MARTLLALGLSILACAVVAAAAPSNPGGRSSSGRGGSATAPAQRPAAGAGVRFGIEKAPPKQPGAIRVATYNTLNLFDDHDDPALRGAMEDIVMKITPDRAAALAAAIRALDADILALQEVESEQALRWFRDGWLKDMGYDHIASRDVGNPRGIENSVLSRFPIRGVRTYVDMNLDAQRRDGEGWSPRPADAPAPGRLRFARSPLVVDVEVPRPEGEPYRLTLFSIHHKAGRDFNHQREAEALGTVAIARELMKSDPARNIILLGDFNAAPWDKSLRTYLEAGFVDAMSHRTTERSNPESRRYRTHESERVLDYVLLNSAAFREKIPGSAFVLGTLHPGDQYDYRTDTPPKGYASDHYPVAIDLIPVDVK
ncbi:MAG TPA: endonuclease/exonuclease/phosphatase family protein [Phycisphaerales bacterium]|nr:endonuclease/exonuclease/phosphatase family protein [Phycisphaerales bacterium]HMP37162.1 endonuclease/exonuclease/phosphatase family protein [Phycisphaerales bacterium]